MPEPSKPSWLKIRPPEHKYSEVKSVLSGLGVNTVCVEARCPNLCKCWSAGTATFMILGNACTRNCGFCNVRTSARGMPLDKTEPGRVASAVRELGLKYVVLTSVDRDDLSDHGAGHFAETVRAVKRECPGTVVEVLVPDFQARKALLRRVLDSKPEVAGHNIETVRALQEKVRDRRAGYETSLKVLELVKDYSPDTFTKSGLMLGLGETKEQVLEALCDLKAVGIDFLTIGQYLRPGPRNLCVERYARPREFREYEAKALSMGFKGVVSTPFVRTSYLAARLYEKALYSKEIIV